VIYNAWIAPTPDGAPVPMLAYSPEALIGVAPGAPDSPELVWFKVDEHGTPVPPSIEPPAQGPLTEMLIWRLAQAYVALMCAQQNQVVWKA
jgi:hypothetical protein